MGSPTATVRASKPAIGGDVGPIWPNELNTSFDLFDHAINGRLSIAIADTNLTLTADGSAGDQATYGFLTFTGALTANRTVTLPSCQKVGLVQNSTTGGFSIILATAGFGATLSIPNDGSVHQYYCDGVSVFSYGPSPQIGTFASSAASNVAMPNNTIVNVCSLNLAAGDWDVSGILQFLLPQNDAVALQTWIGTATPAGQPANSVLKTNLVFNQAGGAQFSGMGSGFSVPTWQQQLTLTVQTTVFLVGFVISISGNASMSASGVMRARRWA